MPIPFVDFSKIPTQDSAVGHIFENILKGYAMSKEPQKMQEEQSARELANKLRSMEVEHKPKEYELNDKQKSLANSLQAKALEHYEEKFGLERDLKKAQIQKALNPSSSAQSSLKPSGSIANALYIQDLESKFGADDPRVVAAKKAQEIEQHSKEVNTQTKEKYANSLAYRSLPTDEKKRAVALLTGMGIDPTEGEKLLVEGKSLTEIAKEKGVNKDDVIPVYPLGGENIKQTQRRGAFVNELAVLDKHITESLGKYQNKIGGYSLQQMADAVRGEDPDFQGKVLAARALGPELSSLRLKAAGANIGIEAIKELQNKSLGNLKILESTVDTKAYVAMQKYMNQWLYEANKEFERTLSDYGRIGKSQKTSNANMGNDPLGLF